MNNYVSDNADLTVTPEQVKDMSLSTIAGIIRNNWKNIYFGAVPYLEAMETLTDINDSYFADSGKSIVMYFLANATTWRGDVARIVKKELNRRLKG